MVVTRKVPTAPAPPVSRTASSQQASRIAKGKAPQTIPNAQGVSGTDVSVSGASSGPNGSSDGLGNLNDVVSERYYCWWMYRTTRLGRMSPSNGSYCHTRVFCQDVSLL